MSAKAYSNLLGELLTRYGGERYKEVELTDMKMEIDHDLHDLGDEMKTTVTYKLITSLQEKVRRARSKEKILTELTEAMFKVEGE